MPISSTDLTMLADLFIYAGDEPDQPAEDPTRQWFTGCRNEHSVQEVAYWVARREWPALNANGYPAEELAALEPTLTRTLEDDSLVLFYDVDGWAIIETYPYASHHFGCWLLSPATLDTARGIARRKGVIPPRHDDGLPLRVAAEQLGLSPSTLRVQRAQGNLRAVKRGRDWYVTPEDMELYRREHLGRVGRPAQR